MITIPAGEFIMGSTRTQIEKLVQQYGEKWRWLFEAEAPQHRVYLPTYRISKYPVTNAQFAEFIKASGYKTTAEKVGSGYIWNSSQWQEVKGANWQHPRGPDSEVWHKQDHPVTQVSWHDVCAFCEWTSKITDSRVRLPTEAEWEKAARGTDGRLYPWGNQQDVQRCNCFESKIGDTTAVNQYPSGASLCGVIDMVGNIWEWTSSLWGKKEKEPDFKYPYRATDGRENLEVTDTFRVIRGGSWYDVAVNARGADRSRINPHVRNDNVGFRVAESISV
jgi:formylglycine-generating enzyme required for sulfatase activity